MAIEHVVIPGTGVSSGLPADMAAGVTTATHRPYTLANMDAQEALQLDMITTGLVEKSTLFDFWSPSMENVTHSQGDKLGVPEKVVTKLTHNNGARTVTMPLTDPLVGSPVAGDGDQSGKEIGQRLRSMTAHYNEYSQAVVVETYGRNFNDIQTQFGLYTRATPALGKYNKELEGRQMREACLQTFTSELVTDQVYLEQNWNPNVFVANTDPFSQPAYSPVVDDFNAALAAAMAAAATGVNGENANISIEYCEALIDHAETTARIAPLMVGGQPTFLMVLPSNQFAKMTSLSSVLGQSWVGKSALTTDELGYPGVMGRYKSLLFISDSRYPTVSVDYATDTFNVEYVQPGNEDSRNRTVYDSASNTVWSVGTLLGAGAILDWTVRSPHFEEELKSYGKRKGIGSFQERGIQLAISHTDAKVGNNHTIVDNTGSIALFFTNTSVMKVVA